MFPQHSTQEEVFEAVQPLCVSVLGERVKLIVIVIVFYIKSGCEYNFL